MEPQFEQLDHEFSRFDETITPTMLQRCLGSGLLEGIDVMQCPMLELSFSVVKNDYGIYFHMGCRNIGRIIHMRKHVYILIYASLFERSLLQIFNT